MRLCKPVLLGLLLTLLMIGAACRPGHTARIASEGKLPADDAARHQSGNGQPSGNNTIHLSFRDADLVQIINLMSELTGKNFLIDEKVRGKVTIIAPKPVTIAEAYQVFLSVLEIQGYTVVPQGPIIKIIPAKAVKERPLPTEVDGRARPSEIGDQFVTQLIPLQFADANEIRGLLTPLVSKESSLLAYTPTNTLIITDVASNIARLLKITQALDVEAPSAVLKVIPLQHASAEQLATSLQAALEGLAQVGHTEVAVPTPTARAARLRRRRRQAQAATLQQTPQAPKIIPDTRTNSLVVIATPDSMTSAENLIADLDVPTPEGRGQIHVYYLAYANAEELAQVLTAQVAEIVGTTESTLALQRRQRQPGVQPAAAAAQPAAARRTTTALTAPGGITITPDKPTNSLVISAPPETYEIIKGIIEKLDIRRSQVLVESLIVEVTFNVTRQLGVEWRVIDNPQDDKTQLFSSSTGTSSTSVLNALTTNPLSAPSGFLLGVLTGTITIQGQQVFNIPAIIRAFQSSNDANILATPSLLTTDNEEAEIVIGEERPFLTSTTDTPSGGVITTSRAFEFRDTGITLRITPQISRSRTVRLNLFQEITAFVGEAEVGAVTTTKRSATTTVIVDDAQTIVIGGLIQNDNTDTTTQVPCLGNIPLFGWLFKQTSHEKRKTNLLIFITPHIITSPDDVRTVTENKRLQSEKPKRIEEMLRKNRPQENLELLLP
jgi:general secretion pathway protein D